MLMRARAKRLREGEKHLSVMETIVALGEGQDVRGIAHPLVRYVGRFSKKPNATVRAARLPAK